MPIEFEWQQTPQSIAIELNFNGDQPNHFAAKVATSTPMQSGTFIGNTRLGGSCNADEISFNPHCNGTHTESISHVINELIAPHQVVKQPLMLAQLVGITAEPYVSKNAQNDSYQPPLLEGDLIITLNKLTAVLKSLHKDVKALIIRTLPNTKDKLTNSYTTANQPAFFSNEAMRWLVEHTNINHLLVDLPSVDRLYDDGLLSNHRLFWNIEPGTHESSDTQFKHKTITEMVYVPEHIKDGPYVLDLQLPRMNLNAVPSNPLLFEIKLKK